MSGSTQTGATILGAAVALVVLLPVVTALVVLLTYGAARSFSGSLVDRVRLAATLAGYDAWLDLYGVPGRRRAGLREELRTNLLEASDRVGMAAAVRAVRPLRRLAAEGEVRRHRPRWSRGLVVGSLWFAGVVLIETVAWTAWVDAAEASGAVEVRGSMAVFPASAVTFTREPTFSASLEFGWLALAVAVTAFVLASRPWLLLRRMQQGRQGAGPTSGPPAAVR